MPAPFERTSTDLVPQLLGMFDELARRSNVYGEHVVLPSTCSIPAALQKRLSLVPLPHSHRSSIFGQQQVCTEATRHQRKHNIDESTNSQMPKVKGDGEELHENHEKLPYRRNDDEDDADNNNSLSPLRYNRRCNRANSRPLSGSSIASSTSSSGCSNQGNATTANPYLASVESLADTCASSQGSGDSGVVTVSESSCRIITNGPNGLLQRRDSMDGNFLCHRPRYCDPHRNPVERVLLEIVDTEAIYVEHLRQVIQGYLIFWRGDSSFMHQLQLGDLFSNIEDIFQFNREFLSELDNCGLDPVSVADTFIKHNSGFKVYTEYCTNYPKTVSVLTDLMGQEKAASAFKERQAALGHTLPLGSFLLKPVQRILKYHLLLENLSKEYVEADCCSRDNQSKSEGRSAIEAALAAMTGIAQHINAMKRRHEHAVRVQEIQSLLYGWPGPDLTTSGELVAEGRFRLRGAKAPRHAFLFDKMLLLTKKKEDGLLVYKAHIMCSNLMLIESIPGDPQSFHVIPFDNPRCQYTLQARNLEQKREWTLQIKRVMLENYNADIPLHARQLVLQIGQSQQEDDLSIDRSSIKKQHSSPPEYLEKRKQERERRRSETGLRQKLRKGARKSDTSTATTENSPASSRKSQTEESDCKEQNLNRSSDGRTLKVKDRFTSWRRKSEPGFQSYVSLNQSDEEREEEEEEEEEEEDEEERLKPPMIEVEKESPTGGELQENKETNENELAPTRTVEEIVGHILMQNQEFQKLLEKQRNNSNLNIRQQQRFKKNRISADTSDDSDSGFVANNRYGRTRITCSREQRLNKANNAWNSLTSPVTRENHQQESLRLLYDNLKSSSGNKQVEDSKKVNSSSNNRVHEKRAIFEAFKRQSIVTDSKIIKTALRIRENSSSGNEEAVEITSVENNEKNEVTTAAVDESKGDFGNYDNLQHVWDGLQHGKEDDADSPTRPAVWLTKLCEGLPTQPQKCGSLPRSFQINPDSQPGSNALTKSRFLQRDGKPMTERPFTIASDKPAEINLEDMERYASNCQPEGRIAKFPTSGSSSSSNFLYPLDDTITDALAEIRITPTTTNIHPDHKIYSRANLSAGNAIFKSVLSKAGSKLNGLRNTISTETLECSEELERTKYFRSLSNGKLKRRSKLKHSRESSVSDMEELSNCANGDPRNSTVYYKQGSSGLGARIAQSDYADPSVLFGEATKRLRNQASNKKSVEDEDPSDAERRESETDSFYERSFETIENYADADVDDAFRDSAIFSDADDVLVIRAPNPKDSQVRTAPPVARKPELSARITRNGKCKPSVAQKPNHLKLKSLRVNDLQGNFKGETYQCSSNLIQADREEERDFSAGQSQPGWVRKIVGQLQGKIES
ncbi:uncharacterized protein GEFmeso isoform X2 [Prorops nasuta]|uniref:uncharacterized protein GEFmeso isoform X2 n=1 Tax=Prorops nasuta TaxID=863751 RepID=UPI0034CF61D5